MLGVNHLYVVSRRNSKNPMEQSKAEQAWGKYVQSTYFPQEQKAHWNPLDFQKLDE